MDTTKILKSNGSLMKVESIAECSLGAFCNTSDLHLAINVLENQCLVFYSLVSLDRVYCIRHMHKIGQRF